MLGDILPRTSMDDFPDTRIGDAKITCDRAHAGAGVSASDLPYQIWVEFRQVSALNIHGWLNDFDVVRIDAVALAAKVIRNHSVRNWPILPFVFQAMNSHAVADRSIKYQGVTTRRETTFPYPTKGFIPSILFNPADCFADFFIVSTEEPRPRSGRLTAATALAESLWDAIVLVCHFVASIQVMRCAIARRVRALPGLLRTSIIPNPSVESGVL
jgi:hypothetical protein